MADFKVDAILSVFCQSMFFLGWGGFQWLDDTYPQARRGAHDSSLSGEILVESRAPL